MKNQILISIKPQYVKQIINGTKKFEFRTKAAKSDIHKIIIYETAPRKRVVAEAEIIEVLETSPSLLWNKTKLNAGICKKDFDKYFEGRNIAYAYKIGKVKVFERPKHLLDYGVKFAPQSFIYIN